ncbi:MAG: transcriptional regulator NrdR [bacterium]|nr:transcriptional regulator NrdR [bacterium]
MFCPSCNNADTKVIDSRVIDEGKTVRRRRECPKCGYRFTTYERFAERPIIVIKRDNSAEPFDRKKLLRGLLTATAKRDVPPSKLEDLIDGIENDIRAENKTEIDSTALGDMVLARLRDVDDLAYIRFASVYRDFKSIEEFSEAIKKMG